MTLKELQTKYPSFFYRKAEWVLEGNDLKLSFLFCIGAQIVFNPSVTFRNTPNDLVERLGRETIQRIAFLVGMAEIPSYWKTACSPEIIVEAGYLKKDEISFWRDLIVNGMGQFFYENKLPILKPKFINAAKPTKKTSPFSRQLADRFLVPLGGGKDSLVTYELLSQASLKIATLVFEPNLALKNVADFIGVRNIEISREIDLKLLELKTQGFLNGHTPFSALLAFDFAAAALLYDFKYIAISQERSSNEGNIKYLGKAVNHQYSKSYDFEKKFNKYIKKHLASDIDFFSFLRPLYELQIAKIFSKYPKYFPVFLSCNKSFTLAARREGASGWCGNCPKCLFTFAALYPFVGEAAEKIFGRNLFEQKELLPIMLALLGEGTCKPFECVGTFAEARAAFYLSLQKSEGIKPYLLNYFEENVLPKYPRIARESKKILVSWNSSNNIPKSLVGVLKKILKDLNLDK